MKHLLSALLVTSLCSFAWQIDSSFKIVIPKTAFDGTVQAFHLEGATALQNGLKQQGVEVAIVKEDAPVASNAINLGFPDSTTTYHGYDGSIRIKDHAVYLAGNDSQPMGKKDNHASYWASYRYTMGSIKALTVFMEDYLNMRFVCATDAGLVAHKQPELPDSLDRYVKAPVQFATGRIFTHLFDYACNNYGCGQVYLYGGHSHPVAIDQKIYGKTHPEYYSLYKGKRTNEEHYCGHCLTNPDVKELIYKEILAKLDKGFRAVELSQTDGNKPCECENCLAVHPDAGERLWIFHKELAERLLKDRPGKMVVMICYWPNSNPPQTFKEFPPNVMIELTRYADENLADWKDYKVPGGFSFYIYNWGYYQLEGLTPKNCHPDFLGHQVKNFLDMNIDGLYRCGYGELRGLEGAGYYVYGHLFSHPEKNPQALLDEFCDFTFGKAAPEMKEFYDLLYSRQNLNCLPIGEKTWSHKLRSLRKFGELEGPIALLAVRYPEDILAKLENLLNAAKVKPRTPASDYLFDQIDKEFTYLKLTAGIANCMKAIIGKSPDASGKALLERVAARTAFIKELPDGKYFSGIDKKVLQKGGRMHCELGIPYQWDAASLLEKRAYLCNRTIAFDEKQVLCAGSAPGTDVIKVTADDQALNVSFTVQGVTAKEMGDDRFTVFIENAEGQIMVVKAWHFAFDKTFTSIRLKNSRENDGKDPVQQNCPNKGCTQTLTDSPDGAVWTFRIPYEHIGGKPTAPRKFNAEHAACEKGTKKYTTFSIWEINLDRLNWRQDLDGMGTLQIVKSSK